MEVSEQNEYGNSKLPFELLQIVFEYYAVEDGPSNPLENLLMVCKTWLAAASNHTSIWDRYKLTIDSRRDLEYWSFSIPGRLRRCLPNALITIDIRGTLNKPGVVYTRHGDALFLALSGETGEVAHRWKMFSSMYEINWATREALERAFSFPTPHLRGFLLGGASLTKPILPFTPVLKIFTFLYGFVPSFPDLQNVKYLDIRGDAIHSFNGEAIVKAQKVEEMILAHYNSSFNVPVIFPELRELSIRGTLKPYSLMNFSAPNLKRLKINYPYSVVLESRDLNLGGLEELALDARGAEDYWPLVEKRGLKRLIGAKLGVRCIRMDRRVAGDILALLKEEVKFSFQSRYLTLRLGDFEMELAPGEDRLRSIEEFIEKTGLLE